MYRSRPGCRYRDRVRSLVRSRAVIVLTLVCCLLSAERGPTVVDDVVDTIEVQMAAPSDGDDTSMVPAVAQPQPSADDFDSRLYRADLARAKRWGS